MNHELDLFKQQLKLQLESDKVVQELNLFDLLKEAGMPVRVGSSALGLMVWPDIDITVICPILDIDKIAKIASKLLVHSGILELRFINDSGSFRQDSAYPDGLYLGGKYQSGNGKTWKLDIWFVDEPDRQPDLQHLKTLPDRLTPEIRDSILKIKSVWATNVEYGKSVKSYDIYIAVLDEHIRTPAQFDAWLRNKQNKSNSLGEKPS